MIKYVYRIVVVSSEARVFTGVKPILVFNKSGAILLALNYIQLYKIMHAINILAQIGG